MPQLAIDPESWEALNRLLDQALELPPPERSRWIEGLPPECEALKPRLRDLLSHASRRSGLFSTLPKLDPTLEDAEADAARQTEAPGLEVGPYRLVRELGQGGMGTVWLAERSDGLVNRPVALKLPRGSWRRSLLAERMAREREILATLDHPNIARLYDAGLTAGGAPFLALEYVEGKAIDEYCATEKLDLRARLALFLQVAKAVAHAHARLVVHRDLKPSNILVTRDGQARLLDFGIAKLLDADGVKAGLTELMGRPLTPEYASPEQITGEPIGVASDVYSLGVVLFELLTEARPYKLARDSRGALETAILEAQAPKPSETARTPSFRKALRGDLDTIVLHALEKDKAHRYATVNAFADDIERYLDGRPVLARPDSRWYRAARFVRRNKLGVAAAAAVLLAVLGGAGIALWQARVARAEQRRAEVVKEFIAAVFRDANLEEGEGKSLSALDLLKRAQGRMEKRLETDAAVRAELLSILGASFMSLGDTAAAESVADQAMKAARGPFPDGHPLVLRAGLLRSWVLMFRGKTAEARRELDEVFESLERGATLDTADLVVAWRLRCGLDVDAGNREEAEASGKEAVRLADEGLPDDHPEKLLALLELAYAHLEAGHSGEALPVAERAYRLALAAHPENPRHPNVIKARTRYGDALADDGQVAPGVEQLEQAVRDASTVFGPESMTVGLILQTLVAYQVKLGRIPEALEGSLRSLVIHERFFEPASFSRIAAARWRAQALMGAFKEKEARAPFTAAYEAATATLGPSDKTTLDLRARLALLLACDADFTRARQEIAAVTEAAPGAKGLPPYLPSFISGQIERLAGRYAMALELQERALGLIEGSPARRALALVEIGMLRVELGRPDEALTTLEEAGRLLAETTDRLEPHGAEVLLGRGRAHLARGRAAEALGDLEKADRFWQEFDAASRWAGETSFWLSKAHAALGQARASENARLRALDVLARSTRPGDERLLRMARRSGAPS